MDQDSESFTYKTLLKSNKNDVYVEAQKVADEKPVDFGNFWGCVLSELQNKLWDEHHSKPAANSN